MKEATINNIEFAKNTAIISFSIGTLLFLLFWVFEYFNFKNATENLMMIGACYTFLAVLANSMIFLSTLLNVLSTPKYYAKILASAGLVLLNLPISIGYLYLIMSYLYPQKG